MTFKIRQKPKYEALPKEKITFTVGSYEEESLADIITMLKDHINDMNRYHETIEIPEEIPLEEIKLQAESDYDYGCTDSSPIIEVSYLAEPSKKSVEEHKEKYRKKVAAYEKWKTDNAEQITKELERRKEREIKAKEQHKIKRKQELEEEIRRAQEKLNSL